MPDDFKTLSEDPLLQSCQCLKEVREQLKLIPAYRLAESSHDAFIDFLCLPSVKIQGPRTVQKGMVCLPDISITPSVYHYGLKPRLWLVPPEQLSASFSDGQFYIDPHRPLFRERRLDRTSGAPNVWIAELPFHVPDNEQVLRGVHLWEFQLEFADFHENGPACFGFKFNLEIDGSSGKGRGQIRLRCEKSNIANIRSLPRDYDIDIEGEGDVCFDLKPMTDESEPSNRQFIECPVTVNKDRENLRCRVLSIKPLADLRGSLSGQLMPIATGTPLVLHSVSTHERPTLVLGRYSKNHSVDMLFPSMETSISRVNTFIEIHRDELIIRNAHTEHGDKKDSFGRTFVNKQLLWKDRGQSSLIEGRHELELGGADKHSIPPFPVPMTIYHAWNDPSTGGIPPVEACFEFLSCQLRKGARKEHNSRFDAVRLDYLQPPTCEKIGAIHIMLARQLFLNLDGEPVNPGGTTAFKAIRLFCGSEVGANSDRNLFFIQPLQDAVLEVDGQPILRQHIVPLVFDMKIRLLRIRSRDATEFIWTAAPKSNDDQPRPGCYPAIAAAQPSMSN
jgi:hypothetical protein